MSSRRYNRRCNRRYYDKAAFDDPEVKEKDQANREQISNSISYLNRAQHYRVGDVMDSVRNMLTPYFAIIEVKKQIFQKFPLLINTFIEEY